MECPNCNRENLDDVKFCSGCDINFEEILKCKDCDAELAHDDSFCSACGKPVEEPEIRGTLARETSFQEIAKSVAEEPNQTKEDNPKTTKDRKRDFVILGLIIGIILIVVIISNLTEDSSSSSEDIRKTWDAGTPRKTDTGTLSLSRKFMGVILELIRRPFQSPLLIS